jgi:putative FmdB family regulatory protein
MPIYAYRCASCGHAKDVLQKFSDPLLTSCPACGAESFRKQLTAAGFQLKGSGWYVTDFKGGPPAAKPDAAKPDAPSAEGAALPDSKKPTDAVPASTPPAAAAKPDAGPAAATPTASSRGGSAPAAQ